MSNPAQSRPSIEVKPEDLPLHCPTANAPLWSQHPRVYLDVAKTGEAVCPYCSARYVLQGGPLKGGHH